MSHGVENVLIVTQAEDIEVFLFVGYYFGLG